ncbi:SDR family NAD(P)-dependent oxidoreductase [Mycolicibacterium goodii]|uniref:Glucose 1-dehydrogenase n=1 Tax=Mycolicibacterium goodii TaxID=134601 RepID=A0ABS6HWT0_MYCGD|nr:glucose 1-dehydrogenase [Mycolicibacterium goodii]MBU8827131.1 glucose 1-dehydrogenase [Mycolicibacterium goodii]MBU8835023.1 glucose 1-dehydrogenase [Mycolicibacterium goodii]
MHSDVASRTGSTFAGKVVMVTGGGSGIGAATCRILAASGARVVVAGRSLEAVKETAQQVIAAGGIATAIRCDVTVEVDVAAAVDLAVGEYGRLDGAFNNAGVSMNNKLTADLEAAEWHAVMDVNLTGVFHCMKHEIKAMQQSGGGAIVNTSSMNGIVAIPFSSEYTASKHAVIGATRGAASEAAQTGVRVNAVLPGLIETPMIAGLVDDPGFRAHFDTALARHSIGRFGRPEDVGYAVKWLLSDEAAFVNGATLAVDGGYTAR